MKIHHNTAKRAKKFGITLEVVENDIVASKDGKTVASGPMGNKVLDDAIARLGLVEMSAKPKAVKAPKKKARHVSDDEEGDEDGEEGDGEEEGRSIIRSKYKTRYKPFKMTCGDDMSQQVAKHVKVKDETDKKLRIDPEKLRAFAKANGCWDPAYAKLNIGMQRMNVVNRLRAKVRRDKHKVVWA